MIRLHRVLAEAVIEALAQVFLENRYADRVLEKVLKSNPKWGSRDRGFIASTTYSIVRYYRLYSFVSDKTPGVASDFWHLLAAYWLQQGVDWPGWPELAGMSAEKMKERLILATGQPVVAESYPDWLYTLAGDELGDAWPGIARSLNEEAEVVLRPNTLKTDTETLQKKLATEGIECQLLYPHALILTERKNVYASKAFQQGWFEVQDGSSQCIAPLLEVEPGMRVIDACAGAGGKTLHLAALMQNKGQLIAMDTENYKLEELQRRARRAGAGNIQTRLIESSKTIKRLEGSADRLLLDVPCTGLGVLRRNPDAKWKLQPAFLDEVRGWQSDILERYSRMLKPGGKMVYATCSVLPSENEQQVQRFLANNPSFRLQEQQSILPERGYDGFFMARLVKE